MNDSTRYLMIFVLLVKLQVMRLEITWRGDAPLKASFPDWRITEKKNCKRKGSNYGPLSHETDALVC